MYTLEEVINRWRRGQLTTEQAIGQIMQVVHELNQRLGKIEKQLFNGSAATSGGSDK